MNISDHPDVLIPVGYTIERLFWSFRDTTYRCKYRLTTVLASPNSHSADIGQLLSFWITLIDSKSYKNGLLNSIFQRLMVCICPHDEQPWLLFNHGYHATMYGYHATTWLPYNHGYHASPSDVQCWKSHLRTQTCTSQRIFLMTPCSHITCPSMIGSREQLVSIDIAQSILYIVHCV